MPIDPSLNRKARRRARELALHRVYAWDQKRQHDDGLLAVDDGRHAADAPPALAASVQALFALLIQELPAIDAAIGPALTNWTLRRLAVPERCLLRLGAAELLYARDVPAKVAINEYIELAKEYGSEIKSASLVNAVLDKIAQQHRPEEIAGRAAADKSTDA